VSIELNEQEQGRLQILKTGALISIIKALEETGFPPPVDFLAALICLPDMAYYHSLDREAQKVIYGMLESTNLLRVVDEQPDNGIALALRSYGLTDKELEDLDICKKLMTLTCLMVVTSARSAFQLPEEIIKAIARLPDMQPMFEMKDEEMRDKMLAVLKENGLSKLIEATD